MESIIVHGKNNYASVRGIIDAYLHFYPHATLGELENAFTKMIDYNTLFLSK